MMNSNRTQGQSRRGYGQGQSQSYYGREYDEGRFTTGSRPRYSGDRNETSWDFDRQSRGESPRNYRSGGQASYRDSYQGGNYQGGGYSSGGSYRGMDDDIPRDQNQSYYTGRYSSNRDLGDDAGDDEAHRDYAYGGYGSRGRTSYGSGYGRDYGDDRYTQRDQDEGRRDAGSQRGGYRGSSDRY